MKLFSHPVSLVREMLLTVRKQSRQWHNSGRLCEHGREVADGAAWRGCLAGLPGSLLSVDMLDIIHLFITFLVLRVKGKTACLDRINCMIGREKMCRFLQFITYLHLMTKMKKFSLCIFVSSICK